MRNLVIVGAGSWSKNIVELFNLEKQLAFFYDKPYTNERHYGRPVADRVQSDCDPVFYISSVGDPRNKRNLINDLLRIYPYLNAINYIHESCVILPSAKLGNGIYMQPQGILYVNTVIGDHVSMCGACNVGHDSRIGDYCTLSPRTLICGNVRVMDGVFFGVGSSVIPNINIGEGSVIAAGAAVTRDVPPNQVWGGVPAKQIGTVNPWKEYR